MIDAIRHAYDALNRNDIAGFMAMFDERVVRMEFPDSPAGGTYRGRAAVTDHVIAGRSRWAEGACTPERFSVVGGHVIVSVQVRVRLKDETEWRVGQVADLFTFRDGKAIAFHSFATGDQARAHAARPADLSM
jgi:ketosteroid isomerase-like protein